MFLNGNVFCFFEQSGVFKSVFRDLGYKAYDIDIENSFSSTDFVLDVFEEIENAYDNKPSVFDLISPGDLSFAFFPCTYFSTQNYFLIVPSAAWSIDDNIDRVNTRSKYHTLLLKLYSIFLDRGLRLIIENPFHSSTYLRYNFIRPSFIDFNRSDRGDFFKKSTAYWFVNCVPCYRQTYSSSDNTYLVDISNGFSRSMISAAYAKNFVCDNVLGLASGFPQQLDFFS